MLDNMNNQMMKEAINWDQAQSECSGNVTKREVRNSWNRSGFYFLGAITYVNSILDFQWKLKTILDKFKYSVSFYLMDIINKVIKE